MDMHRISEIIDWFAGSGLQSFELAEGNDRIQIERPAEVTTNQNLAAEVHTAPPEESAAPDDTTLRIEAPLYGVCYLSPSPDAPPFVQLGQSVKAGETLCLVEAMKVLNTVTAPRDGVVSEISAPDQAEVEQGQPLMVLS